MSEFLYQTGFACLTLVLILSACDNSPEVFFRWDHRQEVQMQENHFIVYWHETRAQAVRTNRMRRMFDHRNVSREGLVAITQATGCKVVPNSFGGDPALLKVHIRCPKSG